MKSIFFKQTVIIVIIVFTLFSIYFGAYLPFKKAERYISFVNSIRNAKTLDQFKNWSADLLDFRSPAGQEEIVRFLSHDIVNMLRNPNQEEQISRELVNLIEPRIYKKNVRHLLTMAESYSILWDRYRKEEDFIKAESYLIEALKIGPDLPPALYPLFDLYRLHGDQQKMKKTGEAILKNWPTDSRIIEAMQSVQ